MVSRLAHNQKVVGSIPTPATIQSYRCIEQNFLLSNVALMELTNESTLKILRCKSSTDANKLAGSIHSAYQENPASNIILRVIGAGSLNQAIKAVIISNKFFAKKGLVVVVQPSFQDTSEAMTAIELRVFLQKTNL